MLQRLMAIMLFICSLMLVAQAWVVIDLKKDVAQERSALQQMTEQRDAWQQSAEHTARDLENAERQRRDAEAAVQALQEELAVQAESYDALRQRIRNAPASDNGSVAPVLRDTLEALP